MPLMVKTVRELCQRVGIHRDTFYEIRKRDKKGSPRPSKKGHDVEAWKLYLAREGVHSRSQAELRAENIELRNQQLRMEIEEYRGRLIDREKHLAALHALARIVCSGLDNGRVRLRAICPTAVAKSEVDRTVNDILATMRREASSIDWEKLTSAEPKARA